MQLYRELKCIYKYMFQDIFEKLLNDVFKNGKWKSEEKIMNYKLTSLK